MVYVLIFLIIDGLVLGIQSNQMTKLVPEDVKQDHEDYRLKAGILTIFIGAGSMIGSYLSGPVTDGFGLKSFGKVTIFFYIVTCMLTIGAALKQVYAFINKRCIGWLAWSVSYGDSLTISSRAGFMFRSWKYSKVTLLNLIQVNFKHLPSTNKCIVSQWHCSKF